MDIRADYSFSGEGGTSFLNGFTECVSELVEGHCSSSSGAEAWRGGVDRVNIGERVRVRDQLWSYNGEAGAAFGGDLGFTYECSNGRFGYWEWVAWGGESGGV